METKIELKRTTLHEIHRRYGARLVPFGGWEMPVQYSGIIEEHQAVRQAAGLFDASHMGEFWVEGEQALNLVQQVTINDASKLVNGQVQYSAMATSEGGLLDDVTLFRFARDKYMLCVNASNIEKDLRWIMAQREQFPAVTVTDISERTALLAVQGPQAAAIVERLTHANLQELRYYHFLSGRMAGIETIISRTGYTGEDGFELFFPAEKGPDLWEELLAAGEARGLRPCGLGARDTLRLEMGYALYGQDIDETTTPLEAGLAWITKPEKGAFIGREAILRQSREGCERVLAGFRLDEKGIPRHDFPMLKDGRPIGRVTSGTFSPSLKAGIGLGYIDRSAAVPGAGIEIEIRAKRFRASVVKPPFYRSGSLNKKG